MRRVLFLLITFLIFILSGCDGEKISTSNKIEVISSDYQGEGRYYKYDIKIPQIKDESSEDFTYFNLTMQENMRYIIENLATKENEGGIQEAYISFTNNENSFGVLSISVLTNIYTGGAHFENNLECYNLNLKDKTILALDKIFKEEAVEYFNMKINDIIKSGAKVYNTKGGQVIFFDNAEANINNAVLSFEGDNIVFTFLEYDLSPYSSGMPVFKFNKKEVKKYFN